MLKVFRPVTVVLALVIIVALVPARADAGPILMWVEGRIDSVTGPPKLGIFQNNMRVEEAAVQLIGFGARLVFQFADVSQDLDPSPHRGFYENIGIPLVGAGFGGAQEFHDASVSLS